MEDPRFNYTLDSLPEFTVDLDKMRYEAPSRHDLYKERLSGFSDLALDIITLFETKRSNNHFKKELKRLHREWREQNQD
jgi:hypothetical protein